MASIYNDIRRALEATLAGITDIPDIAWENTNYEPQTGSSFVQPVFTPTNRVPAVRGSNPQQYYNGLFSVNVFTPADQGPGAGDELANTIIEAFDATTDLTANGKTISIRQAERTEGYKSYAHFLTPVNIYWYIYN